MKAASSATANCIVPDKLRAADEIRVLAGAGWLARIVLWPFDLMPKYLDPWKLDVGAGTWSN